MYFLCRKVDCIKFRKYQIFWNSKRFTCIFTVVNIVHWAVIHKYSNDLRVTFAHGMVSYAWKAGRINAQHWTFCSLLIWDTMSFFSIPNRRVSQIRPPLAVCREPAGNYNRLPDMLYVFEHKTQYLLIHAPYTRWPVDSPHKGPVMRKMFPLDDVIMVIIWIIDTLMFSATRTGQLLCEPGIWCYGLRHKQCLHYCKLPLEIQWRFS